VISPPLWHRFRSRIGEHVLIVAGSQIIDLPDGHTGADVDPTALGEFLTHGAGLDLHTVPEVNPQGISLNVTSACNLGCSYCYADRGRFGGRQHGNMTGNVAEAAVDALLRRCDRAARATIGFLGGEPFLHPALIHDVVTYASARAAELGQPIGFSATTNGTRLRVADHELIRTHRFALTVSIDGGPRTQDLLRRNLLGQGTFDDVIAGVAALLADPGQSMVTARATVVHGHLNLTERYDELTAHGFSRVGFSPVRVGFGALTEQDWPVWTGESIALAERELTTLLDGADTGYDNFATALRRLHAGASSPFPCGAGGGYASVSTDGRWYACHRAIGDDDYALGRDGVEVDPRRQLDFLSARHVDTIEPCSTCWARYLCSGGCHHEAPARTDASCHAIRDWLDFCLDAYCALSSARPEWFGEHHGQR
jgi:uncharacterized protein